MGAAVVCENVSFAYKNGGRALSGIELNCPQGSCSLLVGPSGAGKSTLFRLLVRLEEPDSGRILFQGKPLSDYSPMLLRRQVMLLPQVPALFPGTVRETLLLPWSFASSAATPRPDDALLRFWLERLRLEEIALEEKAAELSVGQQQRLCLIRCLLLDPAVLLLDEPTSALDAESRQLVLNTVADRHLHHGMTMIQIDHSGYVPPFAHLVWHMSAGTLGRAE